MYLYCFILWILVLVIIILFYGKKSNDFYSYKGSVIHHRLKTENKEEFKFKYNINMDYFNIKNPPDSQLVYFDRKHYIGDINKDLYDTIYNIIKRDEKNKFIEFDMINTLTNLKSYYFCFNPINLHFCYYKSKLIYLFCEVTNTPWLEKTYYILKVDSNNKILLEYKTQDKKMKVSPFNPIITQKYIFDLNIKQNNIIFKVELLNKSDNSKVMNIYLNLEKGKFNYIRLPRNHLTVFRIYYQALWLYLKKFKYFEYNKK